MFSKNSLITLNFILLKTFGNVEKWPKFKGWSNTDRLKQRTRLEIITKQLGFLEFRK